MAGGAHYKVEHWTTATGEANYKNQPAVRITVNDRAAVRYAIINRVRQNGLEFVERSAWAAHKNRSEKMKDDWSYRNIAIHHAGRSFACGPAALQLQEIQIEQMARIKADDIGYHYAIDCFGNIYEGRDIRFKGEHVREHNTGTIGIVLLENLAASPEGGDAVATVKSLLDAVGYGKRPVVPTAQMQSTEKVIGILREFFGITALGGHREFPDQAGDGKICPGNIGLDLVKQLRSTTGLAAP
jgi:hypothetical protein